VNTFPLNSYPFDSEIIGYEPDGRFVILDPSLQPGKYDTPERKGRVEIKNGYLVVCREQELVGEANDKFVPFYLFWRK